MNTSMKIWSTLVLAIFVFQATFLPTTSYSFVTANVVSIDALEAPNSVRKLEDEEVVISTNNNNNNVKINDQSTEEFKFVPLDTKLSQRAFAVDRYKSDGMKLNEIDDDHQAIDLNKLGDYRYEYYLSANPMNQVRQLAKVRGTLNQQTDNSANIRSFGNENNNEIQFGSNNFGLDLNNIKQNNINNEGVYTTNNNLAAFRKYQALNRNNNQFINRNYQQQQPLATYLTTSRLYKDGNGQSRDYQVNEDTLIKRAYGLPVELFPQTNSGGDSNVFYRSPFPKRAKCHGGLAHDCDVKDFLSVMSNRRFWESPTSPGR